MKTYLDIYDVKNSQEQDEHGENCEKYFFLSSFLTFSSKSSQLMALKL